MKKDKLWDGELKKRITEFVGGATKEGIPENVANREYYKREEK